MVMFQYHIWYHIPTSHCSKSDKQAIYYSNERWTTRYTRTFGNLKNAKTTNNWVEIKLSTLDNKF